MVDAALQSPSLGGSARRRSALRKAWRRKSTIAFLMTLPLILLIALLVIYPAFYSIHLATLNKSMERFVGVGNFLFLFKRETFWMVVKQSCIFAITAVIFKALIGFIVAHFVHNIPSRGQRKWRGMLLVPWVIPPAMSCLAWLWLFDPSYSAFNWILECFGIGPIPWTGDADWARFSVILVNVWIGAPFFMIMYLAALKSVPEQLYEAAAIDGANWWQRIWYVTLPMMRNIMAITALFSLIVTFANFDIVRILTAGGPIDRTHVFATWSFWLGIQGNDIPLGAAVSLFMVPILAVRRSLHPARHQSARERNVMTTAAIAPETAAAPRPKYGSMSQDRRWALRWSYFFLTLFAIFFLMPPLYMLITSLKTSAEISAATNPWWVYHPTLSNYIELLTSSQYLIFFRNSALVSVIVVAITMLISVPAAFALSRMRFWGSATLATGIFLTYLIPETLLFIPLFKMFAVFNEWTDIQLINRWWVLLIIYPTLTVPFCTWIMIGYFASIPKELDEAALMDGANYRQILTRVFIPVALPGLIAATIFAFTVVMGAVPLSARLHHLGRPAGAAGRHHHLADQGRRVQLGSDHDRGAARRRSAADHLRLPDGLLHRRPHCRRHERLIERWRRSRFARWSSASTTPRRCAGSTSTSPTRNSSCWSARPAAASRRRCG